jgi:hypothetical protein
MPLPDDVLAALRRRPVHRLASGLDTVDIYGSVAGGYTMTLDGRIFEWDLDIESREVTDTTRLRLALRLGAKLIPELARLLPPRPAGAIDCVECHGTGERSVGDQARWLCNACGGSGWTTVP